MSYVRWTSRTFEAAMIKKLYLLWKDGELGEALVFAVESGRAGRSTHHNDHSRKIR